MSSPFSHKNNIYYNPHYQNREDHSYNFRTLPSSLPIKSPSPDNKSANYITPTASPDQKHLKLIKNMYNNMNVVGAYDRNNRNYNKNNDSNESNEFNKYIHYNNQQYNNAMYSYRQSVPKQSNNNMIRNIPELRLEQINDSQELSNNNMKTYSPHYFSHQKLQQKHTTINNNTNNKIQKNNIITSSFRNYDQLLRQKDQIISQLKSILQLFNIKNNTKQQQRQLQRQQSYNDLKQQIKILTLQNQKLLAAIQNIQQNKYNKKKSSQQKQYQQLNQQLKQLQQIISSNRKKHQQQINTLLQSHKSLTTHCRDIQKQYQKIKIQNIKLLKLLHEKDQSQRKLFLQKRAIQKNTDKQLQSIISNNQKQNGQKLTISKIKQQYHQNLRLFKESVYAQVDKMYDTIQQNLQQTTIKLNIAQQKVKDLQSNLQFLYNDSRIQSIPKISRKKKSQIYIEQAPQSSSDRQYQNQKSDSQQIDAKNQNIINQQNSKYVQNKYQSSQQMTSSDLGTKLSSIVQQSRIRQIQQLKEQLQIVTQQLNQLRFKYQKMSLDSDLIPYSKRSGDLKQDQMFLTNTIQSKDMQITKLRQQLQNILHQHQNLKQTMKFNKQSSQEKLQMENNLINQRHKQQIKKLTQDKQKQMDDMKVKIQRLVSAFQKQIQILKDDINKKNFEINQMNIERQTQKTALINYEKNNKIEKEQLQQSIFNKQKELRQNLNQNQLLIKQNILLKRDIQLSLVQNRQLSDQIKTMQQKINYLQKDLSKSFNNHKQALISNKQLRKQLQTANDKLKQFNNLNFSKQLKQIKLFISSSHLSQLQSQFNQLNFICSNAVSSYEQKNKQASKIQDQSICLSERIYNTQRYKIQLQQKITLLQKTVSIYKDELKDRKQSYDKLILQKSITQQQFNQFKKNTLQNIGNGNNEKFSQMKQSARILNEKIDTILQQQSTRQKQVGQLIKQIGQLIIKKELDDKENEIPFSK